MSSNTGTEEVTREDELLATIQDLASALERVLQGKPAGNAVRVFGAAEALTEGTNYEFRRSPR